MKASDELLLKYLLRLANKEFLSKTDLNYSLSKSYPETERTRVLRSALIKKLISEKIDLKTNKVGRSTTLYSISVKGREFLKDQLTRGKTENGEAAMDKF
jgi:hypothetical protein